MSDESGNLFKERLFRAAVRLEEVFDAAKFRVKVRLGMLERVEILPYRGHGAEGGEVFLRGRVLQSKGITRSAQTDTIRRNLLNMTKRFLSSEVPHAVVRARYGDLQTEATADEEGFFEARFDAGTSGDGEAKNLDWRPVDLELVSPRSAKSKSVAARGWALVPGAADFGVISDIDDTVVSTRATNVLRMAWVVLLGNAHTRLPFPGVAAFYEALRRGPEGESRNPVFYVSSSPWNLYDLLSDFMDVHGLPQGPIFLKDWSPTVLRDHERHKLGVIRRLFDAYEPLKFVLLGDSGEKDPEIYARIAAERPEKVEAIFIRDVTGEQRRAEVEAIRRRLAERNVRLYLARDSAEAAEFAGAHGLVAKESVREVFAKLP